MNALLQLAAFDVAFEAFDLPYRLPFALRQFVNNELLPSASPWQMRMTGLADQLERLALRLNSSAFSEEANATARSLLECQIAIVEFFRLNESTESGWSELQTINEIQSGMAADWDASDHLQYRTFLNNSAMQLLQPFLDRLVGLRDALPSELQPFFELCRLTWSIPGDLNEWSDQTSANSSQRHAHLLNVIRPELQSLLKQCVSYQPGLSAVAVSYLDVDPDRLEIELHDLRLAVRQRLVDLSEPTDQGKYVVPMNGLLIPEDVETANGTGVGTLAVEVEPLTVELEAETQAATEAGSQTAEKEQQQIQNPVELDSGKKVPYTEFDDGLTICGVQVEIDSDHKFILKCLCDTTNKLTYTQLEESLNEFRKSKENIGFIDKLSARRKFLSRQGFTGSGQVGLMRGYLNPS